MKWIIFCEFLRNDKKNSKLNDKGKKINIFFANFNL
jgi:hypothetical protein